MRANFPESPYFIIKTSSKGEGNGGESASETARLVKLCQQEELGDSPAVGG